MITNVSLFTVYVTDQDEAKKFYVDVLGFEERSDIKMGEGFRWVTVGHPSQPELQVTLMTPGPPLSDEMAEAIRRSLANGSMSGFGLTTDNCQKLYEELVAKGVEFVQPPSRAAVRRRSAHPRQLRQLARARRAARVHARGLRHRLDAGLLLLPAGSATSAAMRASATNSR